MRNCLE